MVNESIYLLQDKLYQSEYKTIFKVYDLIGIVEIWECEKIHTWVYNHIKTDIEGGRRIWYNHMKLGLKKWEVSCSAEVDRVRQAVSLGMERETIERIIEEEDAKEFMSSKFYIKL